MGEPFDLSVAEAATMIRRRELSPVELMESLLARVEALEPSLKVWVTLDPSAALESARRSERELAQRGPRGPLHGIPIGVKDIFYTRGVRTTACSPIYADFVPDHDAAVVSRLLDAGAIVMGKTVTTQFACGDPPPTRNPWEPAHTPGGSSSGSAVGVAVGMFPAALGSQTGGSVLRPASYNGVVGLKPTFGRVSRYGVIPVAWSLDTMGFFVRTVGDTAPLLGAMAGHDPRDLSSSRLPVPDYSRAIGAQRTPPRIGLLRPLFFERCDAEVKAHTEAVAQRLADAGAAVEDASAAADFDALLAAHRVLMSVECAAVHQKDFAARPDDYAPKVRGLIEGGILTPAVAYVQAQRVRRRFRQEMAEAIRGFDVLLTPTTTSTAPRDLTTTGDPVFQSPWTSCGFPTITVPSGLGNSGLPLGIQLAAPPFAEERLLAAAHWCQEALGVRLRPPDPTVRPRPRRRK